MGWRAGKKHQDAAGAVLPQPVLRHGAGVQASWMPGPSEPWEHILPLDAVGRVQVREVIAAQHWQQAQPLVVVVAQDLQAEGCCSLFGLADPVARVAVVSTFRIRGEGEEYLRERLAKVIAHEWMHLAGKRHCKQPGCLMQPVSTVEELDKRGDSLCERCRKKSHIWARWPWRGIAAAVVSIVVLSGCLDLTVKALQTKSTPFHTQEAGGTAVVRYQQEVVLQIRLEGSSTEAARRQARALSAELNRLFGDIDAPLLQVRPQGDAAQILAAGTVILQVDAALSGSQPPEVFARNWVAKWNPILQAKGKPQESCPDCHVRRRAQVREAVARPPRFWR